MATATKLTLGSFLGLGLGANALYFWGFGGSKTEESKSLNVQETKPKPFPPGSNNNSGNNNSIVFPGSSVVQPAGFFKYGFPGPIHDMEHRQEFISAYNRATRNPYYVIEHITPESIAKSNLNGDRSKSVFKEDEFIPTKFRALLRNYFRSGYDRGHQAPAANAKFSQSAMDETFYLTNMSPQVGEGFNREYWAYFEDFARRLTKKYNSVRIVTGPLYLPHLDPDGKYRVTYEMIGNPPNVAVPTHFFKLIVGESPIKNPSSNYVDAAAFILPNDRIPNETKLTSFQVPIEALERASGLEFFTKLPSSNQRNLCKEVDCSIIVNDFRNKALPPPKESNLLLAAPRL